LCGLVGAKKTEKGLRAAGNEKKKLETKESILPGKIEREVVNVVGGKG